MEAVPYGALILAAMAGVWYGFDGLYQDLVSQEGDGVDRVQPEASRYLKAASILPTLTHAALVILMLLDRASYQQIPPPNMFLDAANSNLWYFLHVATMASLLIASFHKGWLRKYVTWIYNISFASIFSWCALEFFAGATSPVRVGFLGPTFGIILSILPLLLANRWAEQVEAEDLNA